MATKSDDAASGASPAPDKGRGPDRRIGKERRIPVVAAATAEDRRLADRRTGMERRRPHLHYEELTQHPRPERNINDYPLSTDEVEFINAINDYKSKFDRPFPTWSEVLHVLRVMGYLRVDSPLPPMPAEGGPFDPPASGGGDVGGTPKAGKK